jgi:hypothetical protein
MKKSTATILIISLVVVLIITLLVINYKLKRMKIKDKTYIFKNAFTAGHLEKIHPEAREYFADFITEVESPENGDLEVNITSSYRTPAEQQSLYSSGQTTTAISLHNFGYALDINVNGTDINGKAVALRMKSASEDSDGNDFNDWLKVVNIAAKHNLKWGGKFTGYADRVHFQYAFSKKATEYLAALNAGKVDAQGFVIA